MRAVEGFVGLVPQAMREALLELGVLRVLQRWMRPYKDGKQLLTNEARRKARPAASDETRGPVDQ